MKILKIAAIALLGLSVAACSKVTSGHVGVKVQLLGTEKGVGPEELGPGRYWIGPNEELHIFPTFVQNYVWTKDPAEGSPNDESIKFQDVDGLKLSADVGISYRIDPTKVSSIFQKYRRGVDEITDTFLRNMVRDALNEFSSVQKVDYIYGKGKSALMNDVEARVKEEVEAIGILIEGIYWASEITLPQAVEDGLNMKIAATQKAQQLANEVAGAESEADKKIARARGEAESIRAVADAEAYANETVSKSLTPELIEYEAVKSWDGVLPKFMGGDGPTPFLDVTPQ